MPLTELSICRVCIRRKELHGKIAHLSPNLERTQLRSEIVLMAAVNRTTATSERTGLTSAASYSHYKSFDGFKKTHEMVLNKSGMSMRC